MTATERGWQTDFGISGQSIPGLFANGDALEIGGKALPQAHVLRRGFDLLKLDGILCANNSPLVYFKQKASFEVAEVTELHRQFWNHGGAPLLVLIDPREVQIYSGLARPSSTATVHDRPAGLVDTLNRASVELREFLPAVESGEFFRRHARSFNPDHRVDRALLDNLQGTRDHLATAFTPTVDDHVLDALLCRLVFTCYLFDRKVIGDNYLAAIGIPQASHLRDILAAKPPLAKRALYKLFRQLGTDFNGDLFSDDLNAEEAAIPTNFIPPLMEFFCGTDVRRGQRSFWPYDFGVLPVETISAIYERFLRPTDRRKGSFYTPRFLAELVLDGASLFPHHQVIDMAPKLV
jgi:hypothetical protein